MVHVATHAETLVSIGLSLKLTIFHDLEIRSPLIVPRRIMLIHLAQLGALEKSPSSIYPEHPRMTILDIREVAQNEISL
jgi:hypothetical protein